MTETIRIEGPMPDGLYCAIYDGSAAMKIRVTCVYPPIPIREFDYCAVDDDTYGGDPRDPIGYGRTEEAAIADLIELTREADIADDEHRAEQHDWHEANRDWPRGRNGE